MTASVRAEAIDAFTLADGAQDPAAVADRLVRFLDEARSSLDIAVYDVHLDGALAAAVGGAIARARDRGVAVRLAHNAAMHRRTNGPPPPRSDPAGALAGGVEMLAFPGVPDLMHHKYVVRDGAAVWTGSTNWSADSWSREENVVVAVTSAEVAAAYARDFEQLWRTRDVARSGHVPPTPVDVAGASVRPWFAPAHAAGLVHHLARALGHARERVRVASPVITAGPILGTLGEVADDRRVDLGIVIDGTQTGEVLAEWAHRRGWKRSALRHLAHDPRTSAKRSTPWGPRTVHDFMHAKLTVVDDVAFVGSYNLSRSGESNAEDVLEIADRGLADRLAEYVDALRARYGRFEGAATDQ